MNVDKELRDNLVEAVFSEGKNTGKSSGFPTLDVMIKGIRTGNLIVLAGGTGMGKSLLSLNILINIAKGGEAVCYIDLENDQNVSYQNIFRIWNETVDPDFFTNDSNREEFGAFSDMLKDSFHYHSHIHVETMRADHQKDFGREVKTSETVSRIIATMSRNLGVKYFLVDPLKDLVGATKNKNLEEERVTKVFKELAQRLDITIILCHHTRKADLQGNSVWVERIDEDVTPKYRMPTMDDIKGSGAITDTAQIVLGMVRMKNNPEEYTRGIMLLSVLKVRGLGTSTGNINLHSNKDSGAIVEVDLRRDAMSDLSKPLILGVGNL